jgi:hypothetical protein
MNFEPITKSLIDITSAYVDNTSANWNAHDLAIKILEEEEEVYSDCTVKDIINYASSLLSKELITRAKFIMIE